MINARGMVKFYETQLKAITRVMSFCPPSLVHTSFGGQSIFGFAHRNMLALNSNSTLEVPVGIAPTHGGFADPCLTAWRRHQRRKLYERRVDLR